MAQLLPGVILVDEVRSIHTWDPGWSSLSYGGTLEKPTTGSAAHRSRTRKPREVTLKEKDLGFLQTMEDMS